MSGGVNQVCPASIRITGTGAYTPGRVVTNREFEASLDTTDEWIFTRTGIRERRFASAEETTSTMAVVAAEQAIANAGISRDSIDLVVVATITPDMPFPSTACLVQHALGLRTVMAFDIEAACSGFLYALRVASNMLVSGEFNTALVVGAEKMSSILDFSDRSTCVLFGDGAGAVILQRGEHENGILGHLSGADGSNPSLLCQPGGGSALPPTEASLAAHHHFLKMNGREIFKVAVRVMEQSSREILEKCGVDANDLACVIPHQANLRIIDGIAQRLGLPRERFFNNLDKYGNTSAASIPIALHEAIESGRIQAGDLILLVAFGAGLTWASSLLKWVE